MVPFILVIPTFITKAYGEIVGRSEAARKCWGDGGGRATCSFCEWRTSSGQPARFAAKRQKHELEHFYSVICVGCKLTHLGWEELRRLHKQFRSGNIDRCIEAHNLIVVRRWNFQGLLDWLRNRPDLNPNSFEMNPHGFIFMKWAVGFFIVSCFGCLLCRIISTSTLPSDTDLA